MDLKPDAEQIKNVLNNLAGQDWVKRTERRWWPLFVFHYTDIRNAARILQEGYLYSRKYLEDEDKSVVSSGSPSVLAGTNIAIKDCVRLYFRPKTPTQYYAEGIYPRATLSRSKFPEAHCPVPIFFLFDSAQVLTFVETVHLSSKAAYFQFSPETQSPGPFHLRVELEVASGRRSLGAEDFQLERPYILAIPLPSLSGGYTIRLYLDDHLAYANTFEEIEIPF